MPDIPTSANRRERNPNLSDRPFAELAWAWSADNPFDVRRLEAGERPLPSAMSPTDAMRLDYVELSLPIGQLVRALRHLAWCLPHRAGYPLRAPAISPNILKR